jgi:hypothetical protein
MLRLKRIATDREPWWTVTCAFVGVPSSRRCLPRLRSGGAIQSYWGNPETGALGELLIDCEEDRTLRLLVWGGHAKMIDPEPTVPALIENEGQNLVRSGSNIWNGEVIPKPAALHVVHRR